VHFSESKFVNVNVERHPIPSLFSTCGPLHPFSGCVGSNQLSEINEIVGDERCGLKQTSAGSMGAIIEDFDGIVNE
jgi:hypothetical protein